MTICRVRLPELYYQASAVSFQEELNRIKENLAKLEVTNSKLNQELDWLKTTSTTSIRRP